MYGGNPFGDIFGDVHHHMRRQMEDMDRMMNSVIDPFGMFGNRHSMFPGMLEDGTAGSRHRHQRPNDDMALMNPFRGFGFGGNMFDGIMRQMEDVQSTAMNDPNSHVYSHSTMITFDGSNGGQPRVVEKSVRKAGDVKETRHSVRTGNDGVGDRMSIGHTIGDRTHVIEKKRDRSGRIREQQTFVNLDEGEAEDFDREFISRAHRNVNGGRVNARQAIEGNSKRGGPSSSSRRDKVRTSGHTPASAPLSENVPIITLPDDDYDFDEDADKPRSSSHSRGPVITEVTEDDAERVNPKRKRNVFGKLFHANDE